MEEKSVSGFEPDAYIEKLLIRRLSDPVWFNVLPKVVREIVEQYEREKDAADEKCCDAEAQIVREE